jgi:phosphoglycolate phosphatase
MKRAVIFDFDGTLADSLPAVIGVFSELIGKQEPFTDEEVAHYRHFSPLELAAEFKVPKWKIPMLVIKGRNMLQKHLKDIHPHPGIHHVLEALQAADVSMYILSSNSTENVNDYLQHHKLSGYFKAAYGGASVLGKAPRLHKLIDTEKIDIATSWYVGDETRDIIAAHAVGLRCASVTWGYNSRESLKLKEPDILVDTPEELLKGLAA